MRKSSESAKRGGSARRGRGGDRRQNGQQGFWGSVGTYIVRVFRFALRPSGGVCMDLPHGIADENGGTLPTAPAYPSKYPLDPPPNFDTEQNSPQRPRPSQAGQVTIARPGTRYYVVSVGKRVGVFFDW